MSRHPVIGGLALGLSWGLVIRLWMRFISTDPEFTWSDTGFILGAATVAGTLLGVAWMRRYRAQGNWWRLNGLSLLLLGAGAGAVMVPSVLLGAMAIGRRSWHWVVRAGLILAAVALQVLVFASDAGGDLGGRLVPALVWYAGLIGLEAWAFSIPFMPSRNAARAAETREPLPADAPG
ncbi:MAG: hypothetical protein Q8Q52_07870 [Acidimicrobiia bacterium]|nr:hypothetical protein [Acidimicrobiia bacterium]